jgi:hypothetical protein
MNNQLIKILILTICSLSFYTCIGQISKNEQKELYPNKYTFEKAKKFEENKEYEKAIWFYINYIQMIKHRLLKTCK